MIRLTETLPKLAPLNAESLKIRCLYESYKGDARVLFWLQDEGKAVIAMTDGNMIIHNISADIEELKEFIDVLAPACIFSDYDTLQRLDKTPQERINVMFSMCDGESDTESDELSSREIYDLLDVKGLSLPEYPYFAVDYCHRLNRGYAEFFALRDRCAAVSFCSGDNAIINGIAAKQKGFGSIALKGIMKKNQGRSLLVCCRDSVKGFYLKNGFKELYYVGYWVKTIEYK